MSKVKGIIGAHSGHDTNICILEEGSISYYNKAERLSRIKRDSSPPEDMFIWQEVREAVAKVDISDAIYGTPYNVIPGVYGWHNSRWPRAFSPAVKHTLWEDHHLGHAANAFYGSGFDKSYVLVIDRNGSFDVKEGMPSGCQTETLYYCEYPNTFTEVFSNKSWLGITGKYCVMSHHLGFNELDNGKTMGLSCYGKYQKNAYKVLDSGFKAASSQQLLALIGDSKVRHDFLMSIDDTHSPEDLAATVQQNTSKEILDLIGSIDFRKTDNLCFTGGHAQNCMLNTEITKTYPDINLYVDPLSDDSGCSIGYAKYTWHKNTGSRVIEPLESTFFIGGT